MFLDRNKYLIKRELFDKNNDLYYQKEDNFVIPMLKTQDNPLFEKDAHVVMFMSKPEGITKSIMNMSTTNDYIGDSYDYELFTSVYGTATKLYSVQRQKMAYGRLYNADGFELISDRTKDLTVELISKEASGIDSTEGSMTTKFLVPATEVSLANKGRILQNATPYKSDGSWNKQDYLDYMES